MAPIIPGKPRAREKQCTIFSMLFSLGHIMYLYESSHSALATRRTAVTAVPLLTLNL